MAYTMKTFTATCTSHINLSNTLGCFSPFFLSSANNVFRISAYQGSSQVKVESQVMAYQIQVKSQVVKMNDFNAESDNTTRVIKSVDGDTIAQSQLKAGEVGRLAQTLQHRPVLC